MDSGSESSDIDTDTEELTPLDRSLEVTRSPSQADILPELECPVCFDLPLPPIRTCVRGHIICADCCCKLDKCPLCQQKIDVGRNFFAENFLNKSVIKCKFKIDGCPKEVEGEKIKDHMQTCEFRPLKCKRCGFRIAFSDFENHMLLEHQIGKWDINEQGVKIVMSQKQRSRSRQNSAVNGNLVPLNFILTSLVITVGVTVLMDFLYGAEESVISKPASGVDSFYSSFINYLVRATIKLEPS